MSLQGWLAVGILLAAAVLFIKKWVPLEVTALAIPVVLFALRILPDPASALSGFHSQAVIAIGSIFVVGAGLQESGVTTLFARALQRIGGQSEAVLVLSIMVAAAALSAFMSNAAVVAVFIPVAMTLSRRTGVPASRLLMPLAFASVLGGNLTLLGTAPNLIVADHARLRGGPELDVFSFTPIGLLIVGAGVAFMMTGGRRLLPRRTTVDRLRDADLPEELAQAYGLSKTLFRMRVVSSSTVRGRTIAEAGIRPRFGLQVVTVVRERGLRRRFLDPTPDLVLASGDELYVEGSDEDAWRFAEEETVQFGLAGPDEIERLLGRGMALAEVAVAPRSQVLGATIGQLQFRNRYGVNVLSLWREGAAVREDLARLPLEVGDAMLVSGLPERVRTLARDPDFIVLTDTSGSENVARAPLALGVLLLAIIPPIVHVAPPAISALAAAVTMVATGCCRLRRAQQAIDWKVLFLIIGTVPLGMALDQHGVSAAVGLGVSVAAGALGSAVLVATVFLLAAGLAITTNNAAAAAVLSPVAASAAVSAGLPVDRALLAVAYGCSCAYVMPFHQWNVLVMAPGGYRARDFLRVGFGISLAVAAAAIAGLLLS